MKQINDLLDIAFGAASIQGWPHVIFAVDFHGVIVESEKYNDYMEANDRDVIISIRNSIIPAAITVLQKMTLRADIKLILFTSTDLNHKNLINEALTTLYGITFDYLTYEGMGLESTKQGQSFEFKPYCDVMLDNSAGFEPSDWSKVEASILLNYVTRSYNGDS